MPLTIAVLLADLRRHGAVADDRRRPASLWSAGMLSWRALVGEARYFLGERTDPLALPPPISTALTAPGAGLAATAGGHGIVSAAVFAALAEPATCALRSRSETIASRWRA
jgi:hypothetical protein